MKVLSLFDGISCLRVALGNIDVEYYSSEIDKNAIKISNKNYPDIKRLGSVCDVSGFTCVDLLVGGSPCTDLSKAKKDRKGLDGNHSKLFYEFVRIWEETKPTWFLLENVASMSEGNKNIITTLLGVEPIMINANLVSAQSRKRYFWTNIPVKGLPEDRKIMLRDILETNVDDKYYIKKKPMEIKPLDKRLPGMTLGMSIRGYLKEGKWIDRLDVRKDDKTSALTSSQGIKLALVGKLETQQSIDNKNIEVKVDEKTIRRLTPIECERLQSLPDNYTEGVSMSARYKAIGNAFNVEVIKFILSFMPPPS